MVSEGVSHSAFGLPDVGRLALERELDLKATVFQGCLQNASARSGSGTCGRVRGDADKHVWLSKPPFDCCCFFRLRMDSRQQGTAVPYLL